MRKLKSYLFLLLSLLLTGIPATSAMAFWGSSSLVEINGQKFTEQDYRDWWQQWREPGMTVHESIDPFIDFKLLAQEARDMQLDENLNYKKKLDVFRKVRSLMQFKAEEVDAKKEIPSQDELWQAYLREYTPLLDLRMIAVQEEEQANVVAQFMQQGVPFDQLAGAAGLTDVAEQLESTGLMRYTRIPLPLREAVLPLQQGGVAGPVQYAHAWYFLEVVKRQEGSKEDFERLKQNLIRSSLKNQEAELTGQLLQSLREEYEVQIDKSLIDRIGPEGPPEEDADKIAIVIGDLEVPVSFIYASIEKAQKTRGQARRQAENFQESKERIVNDMQVQVLTEQAALDRHYEKFQPLKPIYEFYADYRLTKEFENTVVRPQVKVADEDIQSYYQQNQQEFEQAGLVEYALVTTNEVELAEKITQELKNGADFFVTMEPLSPAGVEVKKEPLAHLSPGLQKRIKTMASGQVEIIEQEDKVHFIKVIRGVETNLLPLEQVREMIAKTLEQKFFDQVLENYLQQLRERSEIKINQRSWESLHKQLLEESA